METDPTSYTITLHKKGYLIGPQVCVYGTTCSSILKIEYQSNLLAEKNSEKYFSMDESLINHYKGKQVWPLGICDKIS